MLCSDPIILRSVQMVSYLSSWLQHIVVIPQPQA